MTDTLLTTKVPLSLQILSSPNPVPFGGPVTVQGTLSGTENANRAVVLQANAFPFTAGFQSIGNPELTNPTGSFIFTVLGSRSRRSSACSRRRSQPVVSAVASENVAVRISSHVAHAQRRGFARIYGTVTPAEDGAQVGILRIAHGHGVLAGGTLRQAADTPRSSRFSRVVRVRKGVYRVLVQGRPGRGRLRYGTPLLIH